MSCWDAWFKHWDIVTKVGKALSMGEEEIKASIKELMKIFDCNWIKNNKNIHHFSYYIEHPEFPGHVLELLPLGHSLYILGGVENISNERIARLKDPKQWAPAYYELGILAQIRRELEKRNLYLVLPESEPRLRNILKKLSGVPDAIVLDEKGHYLYWVEVKYLQPIPEVLRGLNEYSKRIAEALSVNQSRNKAVIVEITTEALSKMLRDIGEKVDPLELKRIIQDRFLSLLDNIVNAAETRKLSHDLYSIGISHEDVKRIEEHDVIRYVYTAGPGRIEVKVPKDKDFGPPIRGRIIISIPVPLISLFTYFINTIRILRKLREASGQVPNELKLPLIVALGPAIPLELRILGVPYISELEVREALKIMSKRERIGILKAIKEVWIHLPDPEKSINVPVTGRLKIIRP